MRMTCPSCRLTTAADADPVVAVTRVVCARCETTYEVVPFNGETRTFLPHAATLDSTEPQVTSEGPKGFAFEPFEDVLMIPQEADELPEPVELQQPDEQPLALEDLFLALDSDAPARAEQPVAQPLTTPDAPATAILEAFEERAPHAAPASFEETREEAAPEETKSELLPEPELVAAHGDNRAAAQYDNYAVGVRLLKLSPVWLLLAGAVFVGGIFLFSWISKPAGEAEAHAPNPVVMNQATNQQVAQVPAQASESSKPAAVVEAAPIAVENPAASPQPAEATKAAEAVKVDEAKAEQASKIEAQAAKAEEIKPAPVAVPQAAGSDESTGKFTVQVGSYNDVSEANGKVSSLRAAGFEARSVAVELPKRGTWYRVQAGRFQTREEAVRFGAQLQAKGVAAGAIVAEIGKR